MEQELLQRRAASRYYKVGQNILQNVAGNLLLSGTIFITKWDRYYKVKQHHYKVGQVLLWINRYYKVEQVLQRGATLLQNGVGITKRSSYFKEGQYTFVTLGRMETHVTGRVNAV